MKKLIFIFSLLCSGFLRAQTPFDAFDSTMMHVPNYRLKAPQVFRLYVTDPNSAIKYLQVDADNKTLDYYDKKDSLVAKAVISNNQVKFLSVDPLTKKYPELTPYQFASNRPIDGIDLDGLEYSPAGFSNGQYVSSTALVKYPMHPVLMQQTDASIKSQTQFAQQIIAKSDMFGNGIIAPRYQAERQVTSVKQDYYSSIGENIAGGPFGATGYILGGDKGSAIGASFDGISQSIGGLGEPGSSNVLTRNTITINDIISEKNSNKENIGNNDEVSKVINEGQQGKHIIGHNNYQQGKSVLTENAQCLLNDFHSGKVKSIQQINNVKTRVDFGKPIGNFIKDGISNSTTNGIIHSGKKGAHIVPSNPN